MKKEVYYRAYSAQEIAASFSSQAFPSASMVRLSLKKAKVPRRAARASIGQAKLAAGMYVAERWEKKICK